MGDMKAESFFLIGDFLFRQKRTCVFVVRELLEQALYFLKRLHVRKRRSALQGKVFLLD